MPSKLELLQYLQNKYEEQQRKNKPLGWGDRLLNPEVRARQNSISQPGPGVEDPGVGEKLAMGGMALSNLPATGASILLQKLQDHLFPDEPSLTDSLIPDPLTGELKPTPKLESVVPRWTKTQRKAIKTLQKFPTREDYLSPRKNPGLFTGPQRKNWGADMDTMANPLVEGVTDRGKIQFSATPRRDFVKTYLDGKPAATITTDGKGQVGITESALSARGKGVGKELYKFLGQQGKDIYNLHDTSIDAANARYSAVKDLAEGKFSPAKPLPMISALVSRPDPKGIDLKIGGKPEVSGKDLAPEDLTFMLSTRTKHDPNKPSTAKVFDTLKDGSPKIQALKKGIKPKSSDNSSELGENNLEYGPASRVIDAKDEWLRRLLRLMPARMELPDNLAPARSDLRTTILNLMDDNQNHSSTVGNLPTSNSRIPNTVQEYINRLPEFRRADSSGFGFETFLDRHTPKTQALVERLQQLLRQSSEHRGENYDAYYGPRDFK